MRASVVVPLYNKAKYVTRTLGSIAGQTFRDFEVILVDDGSTDGGGEIAASYPDPRIRVIRQANAGPGAARNRGVAESRGEIIAFLDADDIWLPHYLEASLELLATSPVAAVTSGYIELPSGMALTQLWQRWGIRDGVHRVTPATSYRLLQYMSAFMTTPATMVRREILQRWGGFAGGGARWGEDAALWLKILLNEPVRFQLRPLLAIDRGASELCSNLSGPRPIEPLLLDPDEIRGACPPELQPLLRKFLAYRACKTAAMLGGWGQRKEALALLRRFIRPSDISLVVLFPALVGCTPAGGLLGRAFRPFLTAGQRRRNSWLDRLT